MFDFFERVRRMSDQGTRPLDDFERQLIRAAVMQPWNEDLRWALAEAVHRRDGQVKTHDSCGDLADFLEVLGGFAG